MSLAAADRAPPPAAPPSGGPYPQLDLTLAPDAGGISRVVRRRVRYPYAFLKPFWFGDRPDGIATAIVQSGSGGLFGGERLGQRVTLEPGAALHLTTQAAAIVHARRDRPAAEQRVALHLAAGSHMEYLPEPMLLFPDAGLDQRIAVTMAPDAVLLLGDGLVAHDPDAATGAGAPPPRPFGQYRSRLEVRSTDGQLLFADRTAADGAAFAQALHGAGMRRAACGWFALVAPAARACHPEWQAALQAALDGLADGDRSAAAATGAVYAAAGALPNEAGIWCRIVASGGDGLRAAQRACWTGARLALTGTEPPRNRK